MVGTRCREIGLQRDNLRSKRPFRRGSAGNRWTLFQNGILASYESFVQFYKFSVTARKPLELKDKYWLSKKRFGGHRLWRWRLKTSDCGLWKRLTDGNTDQKVRHRCIHNCSRGRNHWKNWYKTCKSSSQGVRPHRKRDVGNNRTRCMSQNFRQNCGNSRYQ